MGNLLLRLLLIWKKTPPQEWSQYYIAALLWYERPFCGNPIPWDFLNIQKKNYIGQVLSQAIKKKKIIKVFYIEVTLFLK